MERTPSEAEREWKKRKTTKAELFCCHFRLLHCPFFHLFFFFFFHFSSLPSPLRFRFPHLPRLPLRCCLFLFFVVINYLDVDENNDEETEEEQEEIDRID